jgi:nucleoid DNA-binding protein
VNRTDVVRAVSNQTNLPVGQVETVVGALLDVIGLSLACGEEVNLRTFGKFEPRNRKPVVRRNPKTGVEHHVPEKVSVGFVPSPNLKDRLNIN